MRTTWEYDIVNISGRLRPEALTVTSVTALLQQLGGAGWELLSLCSGQDLGLTGEASPVPRLLAVVKRPVEGAE